MDFVVRTDEADLQAVLPGLAYAPGEHADEFVRRFAASAEAEEIFARFARCLPALLDHAAEHEPAPWGQALEALADRLEAAGARWFLCGSAALAVRGIAVEPRDVDLVVEDHPLVASVLADALIEPPIFDPDRRWVASWFGRAFLGGARVEWVADVQPAGDWPSEIDPAAASRLERVMWRGRELLVSPLDLQLAVTEARALTDTVAAIRAYREAGG